MRLFQDLVPSGVAIGLAWTALGGKTLVVEARGRVPKGNVPRRAPALGAVWSQERMADADVSLEALDSGKTWLGKVATGWMLRPSSSSRPKGSGPRMKVTGKLGKAVSFIYRV